MPRQHEDITKLKDDIERLEELDIDAELLGHTQLVCIYNALGLKIMQRYRQIDLLRTQS